MDDKELGLYGKFYVKRLGDDVGKHDACRYFVLDINHDPYAIACLRTYSWQCRETYPELSKDLMDIVRTADRERA